MDRWLSMAVSNWLVVDFVDFFISDVVGCMDSYLSSYGELLSIRLVDFEWWIVGIDMSEVEIKRRKLNKQQLDVLSWLLKYRFSTAKQITAHLGRTDPKGIQTKLQILEAQDLISKRYDKSYRLAGRGAEYYLTPKGARALGEALPDVKIHENVMKSLYKNKTVSDAFLRHCTGIVDVVLKLQDLYGENLRIFSSSEIRHYSYIPEWTPDLFLSYRTTPRAEPLRAFLDVWDDGKPFFVSVKKMRNYLTFAEDGGWNYDSGDFPAVLAICPTNHDQKKLNRQMKKALCDSSDADETPCGTTTLGQFNEATKAADKFWMYVTWGDEVQPSTFKSLYT